MTRKILIVVDMQNDFVDGALGSKEAEGIVDSVVEEIRGDYNEVYVTLDTHYDDYLSTLEGKYLPVAHCIKGTEGHRLNEKVAEAISKYHPEATVIEKKTFGYYPFADKTYWGEDIESITLVGLCTDICVLSNAMLIRAALPDTEIRVVEKACWATSALKQQAALDVLESCQIYRK